MENGSYLKLYIEALKNEGKKTGTLKQYTSDLKQFISWVDDAIKKDLLRTNTTDVTAYIGHLTDKNLSKTTIKRHLSAISGMLTFYEIDAEYPTEYAETYRTTSLKPNDFISDKEMHQLLESMHRPIESAARDILINRNTAIVHLMRYEGLRPKEIASINMDMLNLAQSSLTFRLDDNQMLYELSGELIQHIRDYLQSVEPLKRPRTHSKEPLFVSFNNRSNDYQYDYANEQSKRLSARSIQKMIKEEVRLAGLRKLSAKHLRNSCILDHVLSGQDDKEMQRYFHLSHPYSLHRYKDFIKYNQRR